MFSQPGYTTVKGRFNLMASKEEIKIKDPPNGFTLIEVLISITLLSMLMTYTYSIINNSVDTKDTIITEDKELLGIERAFERISTDFAQIYSPLYSSPFKKNYTTGEKSSDDLDKKTNEFEVSERFPLISHDGLPVPLFDSPEKSTFSFLSTANRRRLENTKESRYVWIQYQLESDDQSRGGYSLIRSYSANNIYGPDHDFSKANQQIILKNIKSLEFEFWNPGKKKWSSGIKFLNRDKYTLKMIRVKMEWLDANSIIYKFSRTFRNLWQKYDPRFDELAYKEVQEALDKIERSKSGGAN